jgi:proline iminopeptidase
MPEATLNGARVVYDIAGSGPPCIVLHGGLGFDHGYMRDALRALEDVNTFVYVDQRGNGLSERVPIETITLPQLAADVEALREHLGYERVGVCGHSYGGFVALEYATTYPDRLSHLVLLDTSPGGFEPTPDELAERGDRSWVTPQVEAALQAMSVMPEHDDAMEAMLPQIARAYVFRADPAELIGVFEQTIADAAALKQGFVALAGWTVVDKLDAISAPTLVVCGRHDLQTTPECSKRLAAAIPRADLAWFESSAHFPWIDEREAFESTLRDWLMSHPQTGPPNVS